MRSLRDFIEDRFNRKWDQLRSTGSSPIIKATIIMPFFGYLILFNDRLVQHLNLSDTFVYEPNTWTNLRLYLVYFGLVLLAIGSIIYQFRCPPEVKAHGSAWDYIDKQGSTMSELYIHEKFRKSLYSEILKSDVARYKLEGVEIVDMRHSNIGEANQILKQKIGRDIENEEWDELKNRASECYTYLKDDNDVLRTFFVPLKYIRPVSRRVVSTCYDLGALLLALPAGEVFIRVLISFGNFIWSGLAPAPPS